MYIIESKLGDGYNYHPMNRVIFWLSEGEYYCFEKAKNKAIKMAEENKINYRIRESETNHIEFETYLNKIQSKSEPNDFFYKTILSVAKEYKNEDRRKNLLR